MKITNKKGIELSNAFGAVLAVVLIAVLVIVAIFIFDVLTTGLPVRSVSIINETGGYINGTGYTVTNASVCNFGAFAVSTATNTSDGTAIVAANFTTNALTGVISNATDDWVTSGAQFNYSYTWGGEACDASNSMITQFATYPALVGLVGTIVFLGLVIGVLVASFVFGGKRSV